MAEKAAHLLDNVLSRVPIRQWVLIVPKPLQYSVADATALCSTMLACHVAALFSWLRRTAKRE